MADTMKFGPEWLRALSDGPQTTVPAPAPSSKFKLAEYRYGREEMLALFQPPYESAPYLQELPHIYVEETQTPVCLLPLSEEEERVMAQGVNSNLARPGRGGSLPLRGSRGGGVDRGRGRGRGRGDTYPTRGPMENGDIGGGFGRPRGPNKDGWEEVGNRKLERGFSRPFDDVSSREGHLRYNRSMSNENWRDKPPVDDDDEGDWRKSSNSRDRWNTRTNWREPNKGGVDLDRRNGAFNRNRGFENDDRGRRMGEPREPGDVPEWADDGADDVGTFDSSGAFVYHKERLHYHHSRHEGDQPPGQVDQPQEKEMSRPEKKEVQEETQLQEPLPPSVKVNSNLTQQLPNGKGGEPVPGSGSGVETTETPPTASLPAVQHQQQENGISAQVASLVAAAVSAAPVLPSMPQGAALKNVVLDEKPEAKEPAATATPDDDALMWFYTDPQGEVQGPFFPEEMAQWFSAGYFTMNLQIKRGCDQQFQPLGELMKRWGHVPFLPGPPPPPILQTTPTPATVTTAAVVAPSPDLAPASTQPPASVQPPTLIPSFSQPTAGADNLLVQQQLVLQHQILQLEMSMRQLQMQTLGQLQEQDAFKALDPGQQQQLSMQMMQSNPLVMQHMQQLTQLQHLQQQQQQQLSQGQNQPVSAAATLPQALQPGVEASLSASPPTFQRSVSQPAPTGEGQGDIPSIWGTAPPAGGWVSSQPGSVWDLDHNVLPQSMNSAKSDLEKFRQEKEAEFVRILEVEKKRQEDIQKQQEELRRQTEALHRERERMEREKEELERQRQQEIQRVEEIRRMKEEEQKRREMEEAEAERQKQLDEANRQRRMEEQRRKEEEQRAREEERRREEERKKEEERRRRLEEEEQRRLEDMRRKREMEELALQEMKHQEEIRQQQEAEKQRQREAEKQAEAEAAQRKQQEFQRQQQEALKRLQQQQAMQNMQLPSSANWARQQQAAQSGPSRPLAEIQHEEEMRQLQQERERQEIIRLQAEHLAQQQHQQQQKSWASNLASQQPPRGKSLAEIQEEQERQLRQEKQKVQQQQQHQAKTMSLSQAAVWGSTPASSTTTSSTPWTGGSVWGSDSSIGLWGSTPAPMPTQTANSRKKDSGSNQTSAEFPALRTQKSNKQMKQQPNAKPAQAAAPVKPKKEEEAVQRLFKKDPAQDKDEFTSWCELFLSGMDVQIDIETFVSFLQAVDSPYEVHDYVKNYLGEGKNAREFAKQFLEKRSHYKNKARNEKRQEEESIWGPAPALNPRETRGGAPQSAAGDHGFTEVGGKSKGGKKKKKMHKLDGSSLLGFTVEKDPNRKNAGQIESLD